MAVFYFAFKCFYFGRKPQDNISLNGYFLLIYKQIYKPLSLQTGGGGGSLVHDMYQMHIICDSNSEHLA